MTQHRLASKQSKEIDVPIPLLPSLPSRDSVKGWTVETVDAKHYIPCPQCQKKVRIIGRLSLKKHLRSSHPEENWSRFSLRNWLQCQLCPASSSNKNRVHPSDVINHMSQKHRINFRGPMNHPAWVPTDPSAKTFICPECRMPVPIVELKSHMKFYALPLYYPCSLCPKTKNKALVHLKDLPDHLKYIHGIFDENAEKEKKSDSQKQILSNDYIQCKGCPNPVKKTNMEKHLDKCQGLKFCDGCKEHFLMQDEPAHKNCNKSDPLTFLATNLNPPKPDLMDHNCIQCKGCSNQVKKTNFAMHLNKCQGFRFCSGCKQRVLVQELSAHRSRCKTAPPSIPEPPVPELIDDMTYSIPGAVSVSRKGTPKAVQINLLQKRGSTFNPEDSVDSDSPLKEKQMKLQS